MDEIIEIVCRIAGIGDIDPDAVLYESGFSSLDTLELLVELESVYGLAIPDDQFMAARTPQQLRALVSRLREEQKEEQLV
ncbi:MAG: acyl carrier protein [Acidobacteria bacterium]|nr:acyl carrier protein [Acidobacteriota bacterium]